MGHQYSYMNSCKKETKLCGDGREGHFKHTKKERQCEGREDLKVLALMIGMRQ